MNFDEREVNRYPQGPNKEATGLVNLSYALPSPIRYSYPLRILIAKVKKTMGECKESLT
jgi:hypothetical protein